MGENKSLLSRILTWAIIAIVAVFALKLAVRLLGFVFGLFGIAVSLASFLLFTLGPVILLGWLLVKAWEAFRKEPA